MQDKWSQRKKTMMVRRLEQNQDRLQKVFSKKGKCFKWFTDCPRSVIEIVLCDTYYDKDIESNIIWHFCHVSASWGMKRDMFIKPPNDVKEDRVIWKQKNNVWFEWWNWGDFGG